jgi:hypothetical protein
MQNGETSKKEKPIQINQKRDFPNKKENLFFVLAQKIEFEKRSRIKKSINQICR